MMQWIPIDEQRPEDREGVLFAIIDEGVEYGYYDDGKFCIPDGDITVPVRASDVSHWMPLPLPPEGVR